MGKYYIIKESKFASEIEASNPFEALEKFKKGERNYCGIAIIREGEYLIIEKEK